MLLVLSVIDEIQWLLSSSEKQGKMKAASDETFESVIG